MQVGRCIPTVEETVSKAAQCGFESRHRHIREAYAYVLGLYLGDGCVSPTPRSFRLRISLDNAYPGIICSAAQGIKDIVPRNKVGLTDLGSHSVVWAYSNHWVYWLPQHGPGKKHEREIVLHPWQAVIVQELPRAFLRGLIHSDGSRITNRVGGKSYPRYSFSNRSEGIRRIFIDTCELVGVHWTVASGGRAVNVARRADVALLDEFIGPKA